MAHRLTGRQNNRHGPLARAHRVYILLDMTNAAQTEFSRDDAQTLATALRTAGLTDVRVVVSDYVTPENTVGQYYSVNAVIRDPRHGNTIVRSLRAPADAAKIAKEMMREVKDRAKGTRARIRAERDSEKS